MTCLLDSQVILWLLVEPSRLQAETLSVLKDTSTDRVISVASFWELEIKRSKRKLKYDLNFADILRDFAAVELPLTSKHVHVLHNLPRFHNDPYDRMLIA